MANERHMHVIAAVGFAVASVVAALGATGDHAPQYADRWSGTYQLDRVRSDNPDRVADSATRDLNASDRDRVRTSLMNRLNAPDYIAIDRNGRTINIASSMAPRGTFDVDGMEHRETSPNGYPIT